MTVQTPIGGPRFYPIVGNLLELADDPTSFFLTARREHGDLFRYQFGPRTVYLAAHPDAVKHVLLDNNTNYRKHSAYDKVKPLVGEGLLTSEGDTWLANRRLAQPVFHKQRIQGFGKMMVDETLRMLDERWESYARAEKAFDLLPEMMRLTLTVVGRALFSRDLSGEAATVGEALSFALEHSNKRSLSVVTAPAHWPLPANLRFKRSLQALDDLVYGMIKERRAVGEEKDDLLSMLLHASDADTGEAMNDRQLRDEAMTLFLAGHETTANALSWLFYLLSQHTAVTRKLLIEVDTVLQNRVATLDDTANLPYTRLVIDETLRLYPPAWIIGRHTLQPDSLGGADIPADTDVSISPFVTHRHPDFWDNPEGFDPERFSPERSKGRHRFAYFPFGGGPRLCIGNNFALLEMQLTLATILQRFEPQLVSGHPVEMDPGITLRPKNGVLMTLKRRS